MSKIPNAWCSGIIAMGCIFCWVLSFGQGASATPLKSARVSQVIQDVRLLKPQATPRPAIVNETVSVGTGVRTGVDSRVELTFPDLTITRLGQNTIFTFSEGAREVRLDAGTILLQVPPNAPEATITTSGVTAGISGATALFAVGPPTKFMLLEGIGIFYPTGHPEQAVHLKGGEMVMMTADGRITPVMKFNVALVLSTSRLIIDFPELANLPLILAIVRQQEGFAVAPGSAPWQDVIDVVDQRFASLPVANPPSKFGALSVITSPDPYVINSGTVIATDPFIITNGVTDFGKIYRGSAEDGPFSAFLFGSTSAFDLALKYDVEFFADPNNLPIAVFKFQSLSLIGNPTISLGSGSITKLGLIGVDGITSGPPGGTLTFSGLDELLLATQAGSINLTSDVSFRNIDTFVVYARGAGSNLTLASPILNSNILVLAAEGSLQLALGITVSDRFSFQTGGDLISTGSGKFTVNNAGGTIDDGGRIRFKVGGNLFSQDLSLLIANNAGGRITTGGDIHLTIAGNLVATGDANFTIQNATGTINDGGNITLETGGNLTVNGAGDLLLTIANNDGGRIGTGGNISVTTGGSLFTQAFSLLVTNFDDAHPGTSVGNIGTGGNIFVTTGGNLTADFVNAFINNHDGATITSGATISFDIGGALTTHQNPPAGAFAMSEESLAFIISNIFNNKSAGRIGSDATISVTAASVSAGGALGATISNRPAPAMIGGSAIINFDIAGNLHADDYASFAIANEDFFDVGHGGTIKGDALIDVSAANISTGQYLNFFINNRGFLDPNTNMILGPGGTIGGDATINVTAGNIVPAGPLVAEINNRAGSIGGNATINLTASSLLSLPADSIVRINNRTGGKLGKTSSINLKSTRPTGVAININSSAQVLALLDAAASGPGGKITILATGVSSSINVNGGPDGLIEADKGTVEIRHTGDSGVIKLTDANVAADIVKIGALGTNGTLNIGGGTLSADTTLKLYAPSTNGSINFTANVTLAGTAAGPIIAANTVTIFNGVTVTITGANQAMVFANVANYTGSGGNGTTAGTFGGTGATTQPLASAPPFDDPSFSAQTAGTSASTTTAATSGNQVRISRVDRNRHNQRTNDSRAGRGRTAAINVSNTSQLLSLMDDAAAGPGGKISIAAANRARSSKNTSRTDSAGHLRASRASLDRRRMRERPALRTVALQ